MSPLYNSLLSGLPGEEREAFTLALQAVVLRKGQVLFEAGEVPRHVYFPAGAVVSMMSDSQDGDAMETFMFGNTCMVGVATVGEPSFYRARVRSAGPAYRLAASTLLQLRSQCPTYCRRADAATQRMVMHLSQSLVCSKHHPLEQQMIRWMLITLDRSISRRILITHQELADILGVRREAVTHNLGAMVERGDIALRRGVIEVLDRSTLEARSCECYWVGQQKPRPGCARRNLVPGTSSR